MSEALLLSGGMDSISLAYWKRPSHCITIDYGQRAAEAEVRASAAVAETLTLAHEVIRIDCSALGSGDLAGLEPLPTSPASEWWPFRNQLLITFAAMRCISLGVDSLMIGTLLSDSFHADGTRTFVQRMNDLLAAQEGKIALTAPAIQMNATELIQASNVPLEVLGWAHSCHVANFACGRCRGCEKHYLTLRQLGIDPY